jgi:hypothetical protein
VYCNAPIIGQIKPLLDPNRLVLSFLGSLRFHFTTLPALSDKLLGNQDIQLQNGFARTYSVKPVGQAKYGLVVEFGVRISPTEGLHVGIDTGTSYTSVMEWFSLPNNPSIPTTAGGVFTDSASRHKPPVYARKFSSPGITSTKSYYWYFESNEPFSIKEVQLLDFYDRPI